MMRASNVLTSFTAKKRPGLFNDVGNYVRNEEAAVVMMTYHACRPSPKARYSEDVVTA